MSFLPAIGAGLSIAGSLAGMFGGNNQPTPPPAGYQPQFSGQADQGAMAGISQLPGYNAYGQNYGQAAGITQNMVNNPYAGLYQQGANNTAQAGWGVGQGQIGAGMDLMSTGQGMLPYAQSILQTGFDPQRELYQREFQLQQDQDRASQAARGISMSPYGAGIENKANSDFNLNWQDRQLGRQNTAAQGAGYLTNSGANAINLGQNVSTLGLQTLTNAAGLPYATANTISGNQLGALGQFGQYGAGATNTAQTAIEDYLKYLGVGNQSAGVANQAYANQLTANNQQFNQQQTLGKNLGAGLSGLGRSFGGSSGPTNFMNIGGYSMPQF